MTINDLDAAIRAICPIAGVDSSGNISFDPTATKQQQKAAQAIVSANLAKIDGIPLPVQPLVDASGVLLNFVNSTPLNSGDPNFYYDQILRSMAMMIHLRVQPLGAITPVQPNPPKPIPANTIG